MGWNKSNSFYTDQMKISMKSYCLFQVFVALSENVFEIQNKTIESKAVSFFSHTSQSLSLLCVRTNLLNSLLLFRFSIICERVNVCKTVVKSNF